MHNDLGNYYSLIFTMKKHHNYSIDEIENLIPFERDIYVNMIKEEIEADKNSQ